MRRIGLWTAAAVVLVSNLAVVAGAEWNRRREPEAVMQLTERELALPAAIAENTALALNLRWIDPGNWRRLEEGQPVVPWFDREKLEAIGFDTSTPLTTETVFRYRNSASRRTFAVLEYDGDAWRRLEHAHADAGAAGTSARSRLVVVDAGNDARALRRKWPDRTRTVIVSAVAAVAVEDSAGGPLVLRGRIIQVFPVQLNVPRSLRGPLEPLLQEGERRAEGGPRYQVTVRWGQDAPWISAVRRLPAVR